MLAARNKKIDEDFLDYKLEKEPDKFALLPKALELADIIFDNDLDKLYKAKNIIIDKLTKEYKLNINTKKTFIVNIKYGVSFLGYTFKVINNKTIIKVKKSSLDKIKKKLKHKRYLFDINSISHYKAFCTIMTYTNSYKYTHNNKMKLLINRYWYNE